MNNPVLFWVPAEMATVDDLCEEPMMDSVSDPIQTNYDMDELLAPRMLSVASMADDDMGIVPPPAIIEDNNLEVVCLAYMDDE